ncbi:MAG TPA: flagellar FliJ family protein [Terriglobia bacterium]|nr:flagellar FliJ family protein [Terriglobia bacterium]
MAFQFSLRALLRLRRTYEQRERMRLTVLNAAHHRMRHEYEDLGEQRKTRFERLEEKLQKGMPGSDFHMENALVAVAVKQQRQLAAQMTALESQIQFQASAFREAQKKRKTLDSLRERELRAYQQVEDRREQQRLDDLFARRRGLPKNG